MSGLLSYAAFIAASLAWVWFIMDSAHRLRARLQTVHPDTWANLPRKVREDRSGFRFVWSDQAFALNDPTLKKLVRRIRYAAYLFFAVWTVGFFANLISVYSPTGG